MKGPRVRDIGEQGLLERLRVYCAPGVGDDGAVLDLPPGRQLVVTTDMLVDGVHFSPQTTAAADAGWRGAAANLSDLAAMGATPLGITIALGVPPDLPVAWIESMYQGMGDCLAGVPILGGDLVRSPVVSLGVSAFGTVEPSRVILRHQARPGDLVVVSGEHGGARAGLELLLHPPLHTLSQPEEQALILAHQRPRPRLEILPWLERQPSPVRIAGMDSSDGLADALIQICRASRVGARVYPDLIPRLAGLRRWPNPDQVQDWLLYGGEDFQLVLCLAPPLAKDLITWLEGAAVVGEVTAEPGVGLDLGAGTFVPLVPGGSFQHF